MRAPGDRSATARRSCGWTFLVISLLTAFLTSLFIGAGTADASLAILGPPPPAAIDTQYDFQYGAVDDDNMSYSVVGGQLPPGLRLTPSGRLSGMPYAEGTYSFTVRAVSWSGQSAQRDYAIPVFGSDRLPQLVPPRAPSCDFGSSPGC
ncbi:Ig domain-containing protein [Antrihabitans stalactiti]|nr:Ig domain-containing protein [Antrihabitans stalactiti]